MMNKPIRKVYSISMVRNEADVIESFVRYHLNIFDGMVILDNKSTDHTLKILESLKQEGLPLFIEKDSSLEYNQAEKTTQLLYETIHRFSPDIIFPLDADEFLISEDKGNPRNIIDKLDLNKFYYMNCLSYLPQDSDDQTLLLVPKRITYRAEIFHKQKVIVTKEIINKYKPTVTMGNHSLSFSNSLGQRQCKLCENLKLAHFHIRSIEQARSKFIVGWLNHLIRDNRYKGQGGHIEKAFHTFIENQNASLKDLIGDPPTFFSPIDLSFCRNLEMKYTKENEVNFFKNLINFTQVLADEYIKLKNKL